MNSIFEKLRLDSIAILHDSLHQTPEYAPFGYPMVRVTDVRGGRLDLSYTKRVDETIFLEFTKKYRPKKGDTIFTRVGSYGNSCFVTSEDNFCLGQNTVCLSPIPKKIDPYYFYCCINSPFVRGQVEALIGGASQPTISLRNIASILIPCPEIGIQHCIASILSAYDDLIENNTRRIAILEEMARLIYQEWFVNFRFPGHEKVKMVESELGPIPEGWAVKPVSDVIIIDPRIKVPREGQKPFVSMAGLSETSMVVQQTDVKVGNSGSKFQNYDTLFARITPCLENGKTGFVNFLPVDSSVALGSTEFIVLREKEVCSEYVYLLARSHDFRENAIKSMSGATGRQRVRTECFNQFFVAEPPKTVSERFAEIVRPHFELIKILNEKNANLRTQRDMLLPKLISGEIDVSNIPKNLESAAA